MVKHTQTIRVFDHFTGLALKGLNSLIFEAKFGDDSLNPYINHLHKPADFFQFHFRSNEN